MSSLHGWSGSRSLAACSSPLTGRSERSKTPTWRRSGAWSQQRVRRPWWRPDPSSRTHWPRTHRKPPPDLELSVRSPYRHPSDARKSSQRDFHVHRRCDFRPPAVGCPVRPGDLAVGLVLGPRAPVAHQALTREATTRAAQKVGDVTSRCVGPGRVQTHGAPWAHLCGVSPFLGVPVSRAAGSRSTMVGTVRPVAHCGESSWCASATIPRHAFTSSAVFKEGRTKTKHVAGTLRSSSRTQTRGDR